MSILEDMEHSMEVTLTEEQLKMLQDIIAQMMFKGSDIEKIMELKEALEEN